MQLYKFILSYPVNIVQLRFKPQAGTEIPAVLMMYNMCISNKYPFKYRGIPKNYHYKLGYGEGTRYGRMLVNVAA